MNTKQEFLCGLKNGLPICIAYVAVSFTFGLVAVKAGLPIWLATLISGTNLTSAGQFAGINLIIEFASYFEIAIAVFIINSRYILMSLSISQQLNKNTGTIKRLFISIFVTDEIFALASLKQDKLTFSYFIGLALLPYIGWTIGTLLGGIINNLLPENLQNATGIALYCMFIAIIIPPAKKSKAIIFCIAVSALLSCILYYVPVINNISLGFRIIISSVCGAIFSAIIFPVKQPASNDSESTLETNNDNGDAI